MNCYFKINDNSNGVIFSTQKWVTSYKLKLLLKSNFSNLVYNW